MRASSANRTNRTDCAVSSSALSLSEHPDVSPFNICDSHYRVSSISSQETSRASSSPYDGDEEALELSTEHSKGVRKIWRRINIIEGHALPLRRRFRTNILFGYRHTRRLCRSVLTFMPVSKYTVAVVGF